MWWSPVNREKSVCLDSSARRKCSHPQLVTYVPSTVPLTTIDVFSTRLPTFQEDLLSDLEDLPLELFDDIASYLDVPTLKALSLTSSIRRAACIRLFFHTLTLRGDHGRSSSSEFLADFKNQAPVACLRRVVLDDLKEDLAKALLPWCTRVLSIKLKKCVVGNMALLPSLIHLGDLELWGLTFALVSDYFRLLESLPSSLKSLTARENTFGESQSVFHAVARGINLERLETRSADDLAMLLRNDCPISPKSLQYFHVRQARPHDLEDLFQRAPRLTDLHITIETQEHRPSSKFQKSAELEIRKKDNVDN
ncbi:hypothetical protein F5146DRAFT_1002386 [Armillaria mellea]|nr:hypothetical protein F5146DRAFT_1002386 [Armillaria mellea]